MNGKAVLGCNEYIKTDKNICDINLSVILCEKTYMVFFNQRIYMTHATPP